MYSILLQAAGQPTGFAAYSQFFLMGGILLVMYIFMIRPQQKKQKDQKTFIENIKKGDAVVTIGGLHGKVTAVEGTTVTIDVDRGVKLTFEKTAIARDASSAATTPTTQA
ncbi:MAG: preprotein translocase subunit YajC [Bacteroidetes bacterium]|nr:preprotein translocase subunit YajC [Fibrella sp.]